jgi:hypothetical protein
MGRHKLGFFNLTQQPGKDLCLKIPLCAIYSPVIDRAFPRLDHIGWREASKGTCYTFIKGIGEVEQQALQAFLELLHEVLYLTRTTHLEPHFTDELSEAYTLDYNFQQGVEPLAYTVVGQLEHDAKERQDESALGELARMLAEAIQNHPTLSRADVIAAVPPRPSKTFHLPSRLVDGIGDLLARPVGLLIAKKEVSKLKELTLEQKIATLAEAFTLGESVAGKTILLVDDLFQSGATFWSLARFLRGHGAREVFGLACVKSWRDTDNVT